MKIKYFFKGRNWNICSKQHTLTSRQCSYRSGIASTRDSKCCPWYWVSPPLRSAIHKNTWLRCVANSHCFFNLSVHRSVNGPQYSEFEMLSLWWCMMNSIMYYPTMWTWPILKFFKMFLSPGVSTLRGLSVINGFKSVLRTFGTSYYTPRIVSN